MHGGELLTRLRDQAVQYGPEPREERVDGLARDEDGLFRLTTASGESLARTVILATGVKDATPDLPHIARAVKRGLLRSCPICDGYECAGKSIGVLGSGDHAAREALFLRTYSNRVSVILSDGVQPSAENLARLAEAGVRLVSEPVRRIEQLDSGVTCVVANGHGHPFDVLYSALGITPRTRLAVDAGAALTEDGRPCRPTTSEPQRPCGEAVLLERSRSGRRWSGSRVTDEMAPAGTAITGLAFIHVSTGRAMRISLPSAYLTSSTAGITS